MQYSYYYYIFRYPAGLLLALVLSRIVCWFFTFDFYILLLVTACDILWVFAVFDLVIFFHSTWTCIYAVSCYVTAQIRITTASTVTRSCVCTWICGRRNVFSVMPWSALIQFRRAAAINTHISAIATITRISFFLKLSEALAVRVDILVSIVIIVTESVSSMCC